MIKSPVITKQKDKKLSFPALVKKVSYKELLVFIEAYSGKHKNFKTEFELFFASTDENIDVQKNYEKLVKGIISKNTNRGFIEYRDAINLSREIDKLVKPGFDLVHKNNLTGAFALSRAALKAMMQTITECDDSSGSIGGTLEYIIQLIEAIASAEQGALELKEKIFYFLQSELDNKIYFDYGDFGYSLFSIFENLALKLTKSDEFLRFVDKVIAASTGQYDDYRRDFFNVVKINFLQASGKTKQAEQLVSQKMDIVEVRRAEVNKAIGKKNFIQAKQLIAEGIKIAEKKEHPGTVSEWQNNLLEIAILEKDIETTRYYARYFAFDRGFQKKYYHIWKYTYSNSEWTGIIEDHIDEQIKKAGQKQKNKISGWFSLYDSLLYSLAPVYIEEKYFDRLLALVKENSNVDTLLLYQPFLLKDYSAELINLYLPAFKQAAAVANNRSHYADLVRKMKKVMKDVPGSRQDILNLSREFSTLYIRRPAMIDELATLTP